MSVSRTRHAFALVSFLAASIAAPLAPALAASATSPNTIDNATVDFGVVHAPATGVYDGEDKYRDANGFPLPGWDYLFFPPS
jgi:hypothetical protein